MFYMRLKISMLQVQPKTGARVSLSPFPPQSLICCSIDRSVAVVVVAVHILYIFALSEIALNSGAEWGRDRGVSLTPDTLAAFHLSFGNCVVDYLPRSFILKCSERTYDSVQRGLGGTAAFT